MDKPTDIIGGDTNGVGMGVKKLVKPLIARLVQ
jgi:hypothetical protein